MAVSKSAAIREHMAKYPKAKPTEVAEALKANGIDVTARFVSNLKTKDKKRTKRSSNRKTTKKTTKGIAANASSKSSIRPPSKRLFPRLTLKDSLSIPEAFRDLKKGDDLSSDVVAKQCGFKSKKTNAFYYRAASSRDYGMTVGGRDTETMQITELGKKIVNATNPQQELKAKVEAFLKVAPFAQVFQKVGRLSDLPSGQYLTNYLHNNLDLEEDLHDEFVEILTQNAEYLKISDGIGAARRRTKATNGENDSSLIVSGKPIAFVIMPFSEKGPKSSRRRKGFFKELFKTLIRPAAETAGFEVKTADKKGSDVIQSTIINQLLQAELVICDLTDHNPNVLFELGIRIAEKLPVALMKARDTGQIFDVDSMMRVQPYDPNLWTSTVELDLPFLVDHFKAEWERKDEERGYMDILTEPPKPNVALAVSS